MHPPTSAVPEKHVSTERPNILIVEDALGLREALRLFFAGNGYDVRTARDGLEALRQIGFTQPDIVLLDHNLPGKSGLEILRHLHGVAPDLPAVLMSAELDGDLSRAALQLGAKACLLKPFSIDLLYELIERHGARRPAPSSKAGPLAA
jgi:DNA-binding response OmpR family regulator